MLIELAASELPLHTAVSRLRRHLSPQRTHLVAELVELRRRAAAKFSNADRMFFTRTAPEQATDEHVACYKATRIAQRCRSDSDGSMPSIADLCCGIGGDLLALTKQGTMIAVDRCPIATHFAAANVRAIVPSSDVQFHTIDAIDMNLDDVDAWHIDPDRRATGRRITSLEFCQPDACRHGATIAPSAARGNQTRPRQPKYLLRGSSAASSNGSVAAASAANWSPGTATWPSHPANTAQQSYSRLRLSRGNRSTSARTLVGTPNDSTPIAPRPANTSSTSTQPCSPLT